MIRDFDQIRKQLAELAEVINSFKSEAVQLRIVELVLGRPTKAEVPEHAEDEPKKNKVKTRRRKPKAGSEESTSDKRKAQGGMGAVAILTQLATTDFFDKPKKIKDIMEHCKQNLARTFKANEFSGKLGRMVRGKELTREKNADNQYEYKKP